MGCSICSKEKQTKAKIFTVVPSRLLRDHNKSVNEVYHIICQINDGLHGKVFSCIQRISGQKRALKIIPKKSVKGTKTRFRFLNEISVLKELDHQNLMKIYELFEDEKNYYLIADLVIGRDFLDFLTQQKSIKEVEIQGIFKVFIEMIRFLLEKNVTSVDLRPEKIIFEDWSSFKIINYGTSVFSNSGEKIRRNRGRVEFSPPEVYLKNSKNNHDLWPLGVLLFIMMTGELPFHGNSETEIIENLIKGSLNSSQLISKEFSEQSFDFLKKILNIEASSRLSTTQALSHPWLSLNESPCLSEAVKVKIFSNLFQLRANYQLKNSLLCFIKNELTKHCEKQELFINFKAKDSEMTGKVSIDDVRTCCKNVWGEKINLDEVEKTLADFDFQQSGLVDYDLFSQAFLEREKIVDFERVENFFKSFDGNWKVFEDEVRELVENFEVESETWEKICEMVAVDRGGMEMKEFKNIMISLLK
jgi:calcium-dependent protein kinase